jgi:Ras-related protein Rab-1A
MFSNFFFRKKPAAQNEAQLTPVEILYSGIYNDILARKNEDNFSPSRYAQEKICEFLKENPDQCAALKAYIQNPATGENKDQKIVGKIKTEFLLLLNPLYRDEMKQQGKFGNEEQEAKLITALAALQNKPAWITICGDEGSGKHAISNMYVNNTIEHQGQKDNKHYRFKTALINQEEMRLQIKVAERNETDSNKLIYEGVIFVYDVTDKASFDNLKAYVGESDKYGLEGLQRIIVGNKIDLLDKNERSIDSESAKEFAGQHNCKYIECSAKSGQHIDDIFKILGQEILDQRKGSKVGVVQDEKRQYKMQ